MYSEIFPINADIVLIPILVLRHICQATEPRNLLNRQLNQGIYLIGN